MYDHNLRLGNRVLIDSYIFSLIQAVFCSTLFSRISILKKCVHTSKDIHVHNRDPEKVEEKSFATHDFGSENIQKTVSFYLQTSRRDPW